MLQQAVPEMALLRALKSLESCVVLRNHDVLANVVRGGDIDLLVSDPDVAKHQIVAELGTPTFVAHRSYVTGLFYDWGHIDLLRTLEWRGARYLDSEALLENRDASPSGLPRPRPAHEALVSWFSSLLWGGFFKTRYRSVIVDAAGEDADELKRVLHDAAGKRWGRRLWLVATQGRPEESERWARQLRRAVWCRALLQAPLQTFAGLLRFCIAEVRLHVKPPLPWVAVLGPDGSGKSTLLAELRNTWPQTLGAVHTYHLRPRRLNRRGGPTGPVVDPHGQPPRGPLMSVGVLTFWVLDWWIGYWTRIVRQRAKLGLVVFDRHLDDILVDPLRYRYGGPSWLARVACRLVPRPDVIVVLEAPPAVVRSRKQEVTLAESERQSSAYRHLTAQTPGAHLVDATVPPGEVMATVITILRRHIGRQPEASGI